MKFKPRSSSNLHSLCPPLAVAFVVAVTCAGAAESVVPPPSREVLDVSLEPPVTITAPGAEFQDEARPGAMIVGIRRVLAEQPDESVTICSVGAFSNLTELWRRAPELLLAKVRRLVVMGGEFPSGTRPETNVRTHRKAARVVASQWPGLHKSFRAQIRRSLRSRSGEPSAAAA